MPSTAEKNRLYLAKKEAKRLLDHAATTQAHNQGTLNTAYNTASDAYQAFVDGEKQLSQKLAK